MHPPSLKRFHFLQSCLLPQSKMIVEQSWVTNTSLTWFGFLICSRTRWNLTLLKATPRILRSRAIPPAALLPPIIVAFFSRYFEGLHKNWNVFIKRNEGRTISVYHARSCAVSLEDYQKGNWVSSNDENMDFVWLIYWLITLKFSFFINDLHGPSFDFVGLSCCRQKTLLTSSNFS